MYQFVCNVPYNSFRDLDFYIRRIQNLFFIILHIRIGGVWFSFKLLNCLQFTISYADLNFSLYITSVLRLKSEINIFNSSSNGNDIKTKSKCKLRKWCLLLYRSEANKFDNKKIIFEAKRTSWIVILHF